jgi:hypothetical protein
MTALGACEYKTMSVMWLLIGGGGVLVVALVAALVVSLFDKD